MDASVLLSNRIVPNRITPRLPRGVPNKARSHIKSAVTKKHVKKHQHNDVCAETNVMWSPFCNVSPRKPISRRTSARETEQRSYDASTVNDNGLIQTAYTIKDGDEDAMDIMINDFLEVSVENVPNVSTYSVPEMRIQNSNLEANKDSKLNIVSDNSKHVERHQLQCWPRDGCETVASTNDIKTVCVTEDKNSEKLSLPDLRCDERKICESINEEDKPNTICDSNHDVIRKPGLQHLQSDIHKNKDKDGNDVCFIKPDINQKLCSERLPSSDSKHITIENENSKGNAMCDSKFDNDRKPYVQCLTSNHGRSISAREMLACIVSRNRSVRQNLSNEMISISGINIVPKEFRQLHSSAGSCSTTRTVEDMNPFPSGCDQMRASRTIEDIKAQFPTFFRSGRVMDIGKSWRQRRPLIANGTGITIVERLNNEKKKAQ